MVDTEDLDIKSSKRNLDSDEYDFHYLFKLLLLGNQGVGKSSLLLRFTENTFNQNYSSTIGVDFKVKSLNFEEKKIKVQVWDTAGQERFRNIAANYYRGVQGIIIVFDLTDQKSFENHADINNLSKVLIGNKNDLSRVVQQEEIDQLCKELDIDYISTSAKTAENVEVAFNQMVKQILSRVTSSIVVNLEPRGERLQNMNFNVASQQENTQRSKCCQYV